MNLVFNIAAKIKAKKVVIGPVIKNMSDMRREL
jgi:hypothetical protein